MKIRHVIKALSIGVSLAANGNSWVTVSDSNKKENRVLANGEAVLNKIGTMWLGSWNYNRPPEQGTSRRI